jgi:hypothetical protein
MKRKKPYGSLAWWSSVVLLLLLGFSASIGGLALILDPSGRTLGMSMAGLEGTYFPDYEVPGFILFFVLGIFSLVASVFVMMKNPYFATFIFIQGALLTGWILVQVYLLPETHVLQLIYFFVGILLMLLGNLQKSKRAL